ncbi:MAG: hypothetical protein IPM51_07045 [Sphingobacteriaceae bacterium]|nr:hypothetical protein [Sphingobacteriaceae bacterium]
MNKEIRNRKNAVRHNCLNLKRNHPQFKDLNINNVEIYFDVESDFNEIQEIIKLNRDKFDQILYTIFSNQINESIYGREDISEKAKGITAMKFSGAINSRIYCKEISGEKEKKKIVLSKTYKHKNFQKATNKKIVPIIESLARTDFTFFNSIQDYDKKVLKNEKTNK